MSSISIIGSGNMTSAIGALALKGGNAVEIIGRDAAKSEALAQELGDGAMPGTWGAPPAGDIVVLAVLFDSAVPVVSHFGDALDGKIIVDITNPFNDSATGLATPDGTSNAQLIAEAAPAGAQVVKAFNTIFRDVLAAGGPLDVFMPALLKPAAQHWRGALLAVRGGQVMPALPAAGAATLPGEADPRGAALAYRRLGSQWLRIDLADRLASHARKVRSAGGENPVDTPLITSLGLGEEAIARLMAEVGFTKAGDAWRWRGRRPGKPRPDRRSAPSHAFAELAKLTRKT